MNDKDDLALASHVPRPGIRLGLTLVLGLLGTWLMPAHHSFLSGVSAGHHGPALLAWVAAAFAGVILLHRVEHVQTEARLLMFMGLTLAFTLVKTTPPSIYAILDWSGLAKMAAMALLLLTAGASVFGSSVERRACRIRVHNLLRGLALAIASPLLLFISRPCGVRPFCPGSALSDMVFFIFLYALASPLLSLGRSNYPSAIWHYINVDKLGLVCQSFSYWAWLGCAVIFILSPWPETPRLGGTNNLTRARRIRSLAVLGLIASALVLLAVVDWKVFFAVVFYALLLFYVGWLVLALFVMVCPWLQYPRLPTLGDLDPEAKMGFLGTVLFLLLLLIPFASCCSPAIGILVTGELFTRAFDLSWVGWTLDQSTIQCGFWRLAYVAAVVFSYVATARWLSDRSTRLGYWAFTVPTVALFFCLLCYLTCIFYSLLAYIHALGLTPLRIYGLVYGLGCYISMLGFLRWVVRAPNSTGDA